ncbi:MAG: diguanylate cyclase, partial [Planctomycetota bacterium]
ALGTDLFAPDAAYLAGLLHDLPTWLEALDEASAERGTLATDWVLHWQLPKPLAQLMVDLVVAPPERPGSERPDLAALVRAAEMLAEFAGFRHPGRAARALESITRELAPYELDVADRLRAQVERALTARGLLVGAATDARPAQTVAWPTADAAANAAADAASADELVLSLLDGAKLDRYRDIRFELVDAAVRRGPYDRAFFAGWDPATATVTLRAKSDGSSRRMVETRVAASRPEAGRLLQAVATRTPALLQAEPNGDAALLRALGVDELLAVPINGDFDRPSFLLLDRSLTLAPFDEVRDAPKARALGLTGSLQIQNLLLRRRRQRAQKFALTDPLTRLFNRRMGIHALEQAIARTERDRSPLTVLMCDLDHFKQLNDTYGHLQGDAALRATADVLRTMVRRNDTVCRYGGEEFLVLLPDTTPDEATVLATRMFTAVHARGEKLELPLSVSIGLTCHRFGDSVESVLLRADRALYASKDYGRNRFSADVEYDDDPPPPGPGR